MRRAGRGGNLSFGGFDAEAIFWRHNAVDFNSLSHRLFRRISASRRPFCRDIMGSWELAEALLAMAQVVVQATGSAHYDPRISCSQERSAWESDRVFKEQWSGKRRRHAAPHGAQEHG